MREIARFSGAKVTGINNNAYQLNRLTIFNKKAGLEKLTGSIKSDFMNMPVEANSIDAGKEGGFRFILRSPF